MSTTHHILILKINVTLLIQSIQSIIIAAGRAICSFILCFIYFITGWFEIDEAKNTNVYVSGLPEDTTMQEFQELMTKCGIIMVEEETGVPKLKLYKDSEGNLKGDGLCSYLKVGVSDTMLL